MKKLLLGVFLVAGAASVQAASPFQQDTTKHSKMQHKKMAGDSTNKKWNKSDSTMHHKKMKKDSAAIKQ